MKSIRIKISLVLIFGFLLSQGVRTQTADSSRPQDANPEDTGHMLLKSLRTEALDERQRMETYIDLYDLFTSADENERLGYVRSSLALAIRLQDQSYIFETLDILCRAHKASPDSLAHYQKLGKLHLAGVYKDFYLAWLHAYPSVRRMDEAETPDEANTEMERLKRQPAPENDALKVQREMTLCSAMECAEYFSPGTISGKDRIAHLETINKLTEKLPFEVAYKFRWYYLTRIEFIYRSARSPLPDKAMKALEQTERLYDAQFNLPFYKRRLYLSTRNREDLRMGVYSEMLYFGYLLGRDRADQIYASMEEYYRYRISEKDRRIFATASYCYYFYTGQYDSALSVVNRRLATLDSTNINCQTEWLAHKIDIVTQWKQHYREGFYAFWKYDSLMTKQHREETREQLAEMQSLYQVDELKIEQAELQARYHRIALVAALIVSLLLFAWGFYQYLLKKRLKTAQQELIRANAEVKEERTRAEASDRMKTEFLHSMSHEIRTPLNSICGFSSLMLNPDLTDEDKADFPAIIEKNSRQLTDLFESILKVSDLSSSLESFPLERVNLLSLCTEMIESYKTSVAKQRLTFFLQTTLTECPAFTNALYLQYVLSHLLNNATKFTPAGGAVRLSLERGGGNVCIRVSDTGIGIPADKVEYIFERFTKLDEFSVGTGLGLYSCRLIVNRLGGSIYLDTSYQEGACFCIELPEKEEKNEE